MKKELSRTQKKIFGAVMGFLAINIAAQIAASWSFAQKIGFDPRYLPDVGGTILYYPFEFLYLLAQYNDVAPFLLKTGKVIAGGGFLASILFVLILFFWNGKKQLTSSGSARWATADEIREKGLLSPVDPVKDGVIVGAWDTGMDYEKRLAIAEWLGKLLHKDKFDILPHIPGKREYIVDNAPTHILMCAPSRSGKGIGVVIPTFASWQGSMVVADPKRENLNETGAYRKYVMGHNVIEFAPADGRPTSRWNPLNEIRWGSANEGRDVSNLVSILVGEGSGNDKYWLDNAKDLIIGVGTRFTDFTTSSKWLFNENRKVLGINICPFDAYKMDAEAIVADAREALKALTGACEGYKTEYKDEIANAKEEWDAIVDEYYSTELPGGLNQTLALGIINEFMGDSDIAVASAGSLPGDMQRLFRPKNSRTYHMEYGYSCMGYEIAGAFGSKLASPEKEVYAMCGDGSYLMLHSELVTSIQEHKKINVLLFVHTVSFVHSY